MNNKEGNNISIYSSHSRLCLLSNVTGTALDSVFPLSPTTLTLGCSSFPEGAFRRRAEGLMLAEYLLARLLEQKCEHIIF